MKPSSTLAIGEVNDTGLKSLSTDLGRGGTSGQGPQQRISVVLEHNPVQVSS